MFLDWSTLNVKYLGFFLLFNQEKAMPVKIWLFKIPPWENSNGYNLYHDLHALSLFVYSCIPQRSHLHFYYVFYICLQVLEITQHSCFSTSYKTALNWGHFSQDTEKHTVCEFVLEFYQHFSHFNTIQIRIYKKLKVKVWGPPSLFEFLRKILHVPC